MTNIEEEGNKRGHKMNSNEELTLWAGALRYYMGRMTYAVKDFTDLLISEWPNLSAHTKEFIKREVTDAIRDDQHDRMNGNDHARLGHALDRACWDSVSELWFGEE